MYSKLIYTGQVNWRIRIRAIWESLKILRAALNGYVVSGLDDSDVEAWADGMKAGMSFGRGARAGYQEVIDELTDTLVKAGKILEEGYHGKDPTHPNFRPACDAYGIIKDMMEKEP